MLANVDRLVSVWDGSGLVLRLTVNGHDGDVEVYRLSNGKFKVKWWSGGATSIEELREKMAALQTAENVISALESCPVYVVKWEHEGNKERIGVLARSVRDAKNYLRDLLELIREERGDEVADGHYFVAALAAGTWSELDTKE